MRSARSCTSDMHLAYEETFGPVASLFRFRTVDEAVALANATEAGLAAYVYSSNASTLFSVGETLEAGMVGLNTGIVSSDAMPFGGVKQSGHGREGGIHHGIAEYCTVKSFALGMIVSSPR